MEVMEGPRRVTFDDMKERLVEDRKKYVSNELKDLENSLEAELRQYYDNNAKDIVTKLYDICLEEMKRIIIKYSPDLGGLLTTAALYDATESKNNSDNRKFFWDAFDWEQLKTFVEKG